MMCTISNRDNVIDSRDVIERLRELEDERATLVLAVKEARDLGNPNNDLNREDSYDSQLAVRGTEFDLVAWDEENSNELVRLRQLNEDGENATSEWAYGAVLVSEFYWVDYCIELTQDIGDLPKNIPGYLAIDWKQTAENIRADYTTVNFDGVDYYVR